MKEVTPKEAIDLLETKYHMEGSVDNVLESLAIRKTAVDAMEKQIPREITNRQVLKDFYGSTYNIKGDCPSCGCEGLCASQTDYCICYGQRLDWENRAETLKETGTEAGQPELNTTTFMKIGNKAKVVFEKIEIPCTIVGISADGLSVDIKRDDDGTEWNFESEYVIAN